MTLPKKTNKGPITDSKVKKIYDLPDKEFRIILLRKFSKLQEHGYRQLNEIRKIMHEQPKINKEMNTIKITQRAILKLKNIITEMKNSLHIFKSRLDHAEGTVTWRIGHCKLCSQRSKNKLKSEESLQDL